MSHFHSLWAALLPLADAAQDQKTSSRWLPFLIMGGMFFLLYFLMIHPQRKRQRQRMAMLEALKKGDKIITRGGIHGIVTHVRDREIIVKVDDNTKLTVSKAGVARVGDQDDASKSKS
jgi:preprotein translocase subunit YajC